MEKRPAAAKRVSPIVVALRDPKQMPLALASPHRTVFILSSSLNTISDMVAQVQARKKEAYIHFDLVEGLGKDAHGLRWLAETARPTGILTTRAPLVSHAKALGLSTIQRMFLLDSQSIHTGLHLVKDVKPDFLEVMPGILPEIIQQLVQLNLCPVIAGGLCKTIAHYKAARQAGAVAISTSDRELWKYQSDGGVKQPTVS